MCTYISTCVGAELRLNTKLVNLGLFQPTLYETNSSLLIHEPGDVHATFPVASLLAPAMHESVLTPTWAAQMSAS